MRPAAPFGLEEALRVHAARYPVMEPQDAVKLIYQSVFGGGHLIADRGASLRRLTREYRSVEQQSGHPLWEDIGNGMVRVHLAALEAARCAPGVLNEVFVETALLHRADPAEFQAALERLTALTEDALFTFSPTALEEYLLRYRSAGCPAVSHSAAYRRAYHPAYRVVRLDLLQRALGRTH